LWIFALAAACFGDPVFVDSLKEGIKDIFLTPFKAKQIATTR
jgi:type I restriction enzyme R subunit